MIMPLIESGKLRPLVVFMEKRLDKWPNVPTAKELGYDITMARWRGLAVKQGTSPEIVNWLADVLKKATADPAYSEIATKSLLTIRPGWKGPEEYGKFWGRSSRPTRRSSTIWDIRRRNSVGTLFTNGTHREGRFAAALPLLEGSVELMHRPCGYGAKQGHTVLKGDLIFSVLVFIGALLLKWVTFWFEQGTALQAPDGPTFWPRFLLGALLLFSDCFVGTIRRIAGRRPGGKSHANRGSSVLRRHRRVSPISLLPLIGFILSTLPF